MDCESAEAAASELEILLAMDANTGDDDARQYESTMKSKPLEALDDAACLNWRLGTLASASGAGRRDLAPTAGRETR